MVVALKRAGLDPSSSTLQRFKEVNSFVKVGAPMLSGPVFDASA
jgi:hypothetical protein